MVGNRRIFTLFCVLTLLSESEGWRKGKGGNNWRGHTTYPQPPQYPNPYTSPNPGMKPGNNRWERCEGHHECPASFVCIKKYADAQHKKCRFPTSCERDSDCEEGLVCTMKILPRSQHHSVCLPKCRSTTGSDGCRANEICVKNTGAELGGCTWVKECFSFFSCSGMWRRKNKYSYCQEGGQGKGYCIPNGVKTDEVFVDGNDVQIILKPQSKIDGNEGDNLNPDNGMDILGGTDNDSDDGIQLVTKKIGKY